MPNDVWAIECDVVEEAQGTHALIELAPRDLLANQVQLILANLVGAELLGGFRIMPGELGDGMNVGLDGLGGLVAQA